MPITPDIAAELLEADDVNIIELVKAGQPLTARHEKRLKEIAKRTSPALTPAAPPASEAPVATFELTTEDRPTELSRAILDEWERIYQTGSRQLRRWWQEGAPLHLPTEMPKWWEGERAAGRKKWGVPERILIAAKSATPSDEPAAEITPTPAAPSVAVIPQTSAPINLEDFDPEEGDRLRELKQIQAARFAQLRDALRAGHDTTLIETKYVRLCETVDKMESRVSERLKKRGLYVLRPEIERDVAKAAEMIRSMGESEVRRVLELCPGLPHEFREQVAAAIKRVSSARAGVFRMLKSLKSPDDALLQLAAA